MENDVLPGILQEVQERFERDFGKSFLMEKVRLSEMLLPRWKPKKQLT